MEFINDDSMDVMTETDIRRESTHVDGATSNGRVERKLTLIREGARAGLLEFPHHFPDLQFPSKARTWQAIWPEAFSWMNDCPNITVRVDDKPHMLSPWEKLHGKRPSSLVLPFMMPDFRHTKRKTKMESKGERCFYLNSGVDHSSTTYKVLLPSGSATYTADVTFGYSRRPFVGESPTWGGGAIVLAQCRLQQSSGAGVGSGAEEQRHQMEPKQTQRSPRQWLQPQLSLIHI